MINQSETKPHKEKINHLSIVFYHSLLFIAANCHNISKVMIFGAP